VRPSANASPEAPKNEKATGNTQQLKGRNENTAESSEQLFVIEVLDTLIRL
jgi:hypothetical protein